VLEVCAAVEVTAMTDNLDLCLAARRMRRMQRSAWTRPRHPAPIAGDIITLPEPQWQHVLTTTPPPF
jgi:hypothetical protein